MTRETQQTIGEMRHEGVITDEEIAEAIEAYLTPPMLTAFRFASGHVLDIKAAVAAHRLAKAALAKKVTTDAYRRTMVRMAVILAVPTKT